MREILIKTDENNTIAICKNRNNQQLSHNIDISITDILTSDLLVSIELCSNRNLNYDYLSKIPCSFCSVTWLNPTSEELKNVEKIPAIVLAKQLRYQGQTVLLHLAGRNLKKYQVLKILEIVKNAGIRNIFALQGNSSNIIEKDDNRCDFPYAADLVEFIRSYYGCLFTIGVAGYPENHPNSKSIESDRDFLKNKVSRGADFILTQASYNYSAFYNFVKQCRSIGIGIPVIPGIFIISSYRTFMGMSKLCGVPVPKNILKIVENSKESDGTVREFGITQASEMMRTFLKNREMFGGIHVFSLNNLGLLREVLKRVGFCLEIERPFRVNYDCDANFIK